jgi:hypothetical protein
VTSLAELARTRYEDPLARIDWTGVARDCWWLPPAALALSGVAEFEALPLAVRQRVSQAEYAHLLNAGLWLESLFMARIATLAYRSDDPAHRARLLHEVREEAGHSLMFLELLQRSGVDIGGERGIGRRTVDALARRLPVGSAVFWALVVIGEELPDRLNRRLQRGIEDVMLSSVVYRMARIHAQDEAAHAAYARLQCESAAQRASGVLRTAFTPALSVAIDLYTRYVYFPSSGVYRCAGLASPERWRALALHNPVRRRNAAEMLRPTLEFLRRCGWPVKSRYAPR